MKQSATSLISAVKQTNITQQTQPLSTKWKTILQGAAISYEMLQKMKAKKSPQAGVTK
ncbi:hypothetical protein QFZ77_000493 [Paenibacillus sp. V4I3]|uniref:hypothetical protein n=1 Tax=Paenibacillus sp. V4I3 TaxID=3042305 RepID=UPI002781F087|nr:hypothetical protein [Paenibacillus sp. V4I3]MDQ0871834.1 hypothetical protein [Paenibacillus sp. V4I3]